MTGSVQLHAYSGAMFRIGGRITAAAVAIALLVSFAHGTESWQILLRHQLQEQQRCTLDGILFVREVPVGNIVGLEGRIRCTDTREFDFKRDRENDKFTIRLCEPIAVC